MNNKKPNIHMYRLGKKIKKKNGKILFFKIIDADNLILIIIITTLPSFVYDVHT